MKYRIRGLKTFLVFFFGLHELARQLANPSGHLTQVSMQVQLATTWEFVWPGLKGSGNNSDNNDDMMSIKMMMIMIMTTAMITFIDIEAL